MQSIIQQSKLIIHSADELICAAERGGCNAILSRQGETTTKVLKVPFEMCKGTNTQHCVDERQIK